MLLSSRLCLSRGIIYSTFKRKYTTGNNVAENLSYKFVEGRLPLVDMTVGQLAGQAIEKWPNRDLIVSLHQGIRLTYKEVLMRADRLAAGIKKLGLTEGDRIYYDFARAC